MKTALILFAHGARDPEWAGSMRRVQTAIRLRAPGVFVEMAFLEFMAPDLPACVAKLVADGVGKIIVLPMFIARGGHLKRELPEMLGALRSTHKNVEFLLGEPIGESEAVVQAMAHVACEIVQTAIRDSQASTVNLKNPLF